MADSVPVAIGVFAAATKDDVQPIAILACEAFGTMIAMAPETRAKVNNLCIRSHESAVMNFIKAQIGFQKGDCSWQLAQTDAGTRFLGLAAALLTVDYWIASEALNCLLKETAENSRLVPTSNQLKQLLKSLEYKLSQSAFVERVLKWSLVISQATKAPSSSTASPPSQELIVELVKAVSNISRLGQAKKLQITAPFNQAAWVVAFVEWSTGLAPSVIVDNATNIYIEPLSQITVRLSLKSSLEQPAGFQITTLEGIKSLRVLVNELPGSHEKVRGMVTMRVFAERLMYDFFGPKETTYFRAFEKALPLGCSLVLKFLHVRESQDLGYVGTKKQPDLRLRECTATWGTAFPSEKKIVSTITAFLGTECPIQLPKQEDGFAVTDIPLVTATKEMKPGDCECVKCSHTPSNKTECKFDKFIDQIAICVLVVLLLSLLESTDPEGPWLYFGGYHWSQGLSSRMPWGTFHAGKFIKPITAILRGDTNVSYDRSTLLEALFQLLGHELDDLGDVWLMSSFHGQAVYPRLFGTMIPEEKGILSMICVPGALLWEGELYDYARGPKYRLEESPNFITDQRGSETSTCDIIAPVDMYPGFKIAWQVSKGEKYLTIGLWCPDIPEISERCPSGSIAAALGSLFVNCIHNPNSKIKRPSSDIRLSNPRQPIPYSESEKLVGMIQCDQNNPLRFFTLAAGKAGVIRGTACLDCCIQCCDMAGLRFVVC